MIEKNIKILPLLRKLHSELGSKLLLKWDYLENTHFRSLSEASLFSFFQFLAAESRKKDAHMNKSKFSLFVFILILLFLWTA